VRAIESQRESIRNFKNDIEGGMLLGAEEIRNQVFRQNLSSLLCPIVLFTRGRDFSEQPSEMDQCVGNLLAWDRVVQAQQPPRKSLSTGVAKNNKTGDTSCSLLANSNRAITGFQEISSESYKATILLYSLLAALRMKDATPDADLRRLYFSNREK
jgi:hypothetical protein